MGNQLKKLPMYLSTRDSEDLSGRGSRDSRRTRKIDILMRIKKTNTWAFS